MFKAGDRIRLVKMVDDPNPLAPGSLGTVEFASRVGSGRDAWVQVGVTWDCGRSLMPVCPPDLAVVVRSEPPAGT